MWLAGGRQKTNADQAGNNEAKISRDAEEKSRLGADKAPQQRNDQRAARRRRYCEAQWAKSR
jgi:hypothetical protein